MYCYEGLQFTYMANDTTVQFIPFKSIFFLLKYI